MRRFRIEFVLLGLLVLVGIFGLFYQMRSRTKTISPEMVSTSSAVISTPTPSVPTATPTPTPIPLPDPAIYGPCKNIPVLMYHHVQPWDQAESKGQKNITVRDDVFATQMSYLASKGYHTITPDDLLSGLTGTFPSRPILLTFDDGYADFYTYAYPKLVEHGFRGTVFTVTGLVSGADYLTWGQVSEMAGSGLITFADHTWSHKSLGNASKETAVYEVGTAKQQLEEHGLGPVTSFAYPYGTEGGSLIYGVLKDMGIKTAFTTIPGNYQCAKLPYDFRRTRVGNSALSSYGL